MKNLKKILFLLVIVVAVLAAFTSCGKCKHANTELKNEKAATCTADGYTGDTVCSSCGEVVKSGSVITAYGHDYDETITKTPSCLVNGSKALTCKTCGDEKTETITALGHHSYDSGAVTIEATCIDGRFTYTCTACGSKKHEAIPANKPHDYDEGVVTDPATCLQAGVLTKTCKACKEATKTVAIPVAAHQDVFHDALDGTHSHTCLVCTYNNNETHTPKDAGVHYNASCLEPAYVLHTCTDCNSTYKVYDEGSEPLGHSYGAWVVTDATCCAVGSKTHVCTVCNAHESIEIPVNPTAHTFGNLGTISKPATCSEEGVKLFTCVDCGETKNEAIPMSAHVFSTDDGGDGSGWVTQSCDGCTATRTYFDASTLKEAELTVEAIPEGEDLELGMENATISIPKDVIDQIKGNEGESVSVKADFVNETDKAALLNSDKLSADQKSRLEGEEIYDFGISGVASFNAAVTVTVPYSLKDGEDPNGIVIWYVKDDGEVEEVTAVYNATTETVTFSVEHFSFYAVAYRETQAMKCRRGVHDLVKTQITVEATCFNYGYTVYECSHCHAVDFGDFADMLTHDWGDIQEPTVTCDEGGYAYRECSKCHTHLNSYYVRAKGHTPVGNPTCTEAATCSTCGGVVKPALGHKWSAWETTTLPTATTEGEKERACYACNAKETVKIAMTGKVDPVNFESVEDMYAFVIKEFTGLSSGRFALDVTLPDGTDTTVEFVFTTAPFKIMMTATVPPLASSAPMPAPGMGIEDVEPEESEPVSIAFYYDGKTLYMSDGEEIIIGDLQSTINAAGISAEYIMTVLEAVFNEINVYVEQIVAIADDIIAVLPGTLSVTASEYVDAIKTVYTYYALLLGFDTNLEMVTGVKVPSHQDYATLLEALMTSEEKDGVITYTLTAQNLIDAIEDALAFIEANLDSTYGDILFEALKEDIQKIYPSVESFDGLIAVLAQEFPGTLTVREALVKLVYIATTQNITADDIYTVIDTFMKYATGSDDFDSKTMLAEYFDLTLNQLLEAFASSQQGGSGAQPAPTPPPQSGKPGINSDPSQDEQWEADKMPAVLSETVEPQTPTMEMLFEMIKQMLTESTLGQTVISEEDGMTFADVPDMLRAMLDEMNIELDVVIKTDVYGNIISADASFDIGMKDPDTGDVHSMTSGTVELDSKATVEAPEEFKDYIDIKTTAKVEPNGDITVSGIPSGFDTEFQLNVQAKLENLLVIDTQLTSRYGCTVYRLDPEYSGSSEYLGSLVYYNGKYYTTTGYDYGTPGEIIEKITVTDFLENPENYLPDESFEPVGFIYSGYKYESNESERIPVYLTVAGFVYQENGIWRIINANQSGYNLCHYSNGTMLFEFYSVVSAPYSDFFANIAIDSVYGTTEDYEHHEFKSYFRPELFDSLVIITMANTAEYASWGTTPFTFGKIENDVLYFVRGSQGITFDRTTTHEVATPPQNSSYYHSYETEIWIGDKLVKATEYQYYMKLPEYYVKVAPDTYVELRYNGVGYAIIPSSYEQLTLPDGNTLYVKGYEDEYVYGYVKLAENFYAQAAFDQMTGTVLYRGATNIAYIQGNDLLFGNGIVENADGTYTITAQFKAKLEQLAKGSAGSYTLMLVAKTETVEINLPICWKSREMPSAEEVLGSMVGDSDDYFDRWYDWFDSSSSGDANAVLNDDGTVSIFFSNGESIIYSFSNYDNFPIDNIVTPNKDKSESAGFPVYEVSQKYTSNYHYAKIGNKYYSYNTYSDHVATFFSSASEIRASKYYIDELTYFIPAGNPDDDAAFDVYLGTIYIDGLTNTIERYFAIIDGTLKVLTGVELISDSAISYEGMVNASDYFEALRIVVNTSDSYHWDDTYVNSVKSRIYSVRATVIEPKSISGLDEDIIVSENRVLAIRNGNFFKYIKEYEYVDGRSYFELGEEQTIASDLIYESSEIRDFTNGTYNLVYFYKTITDSNDVFKVAGRYCRYSTPAWIYSEEDFKESFYEKVYLFECVRADGSKEILIGDDYGYNLVPYDGNLNLRDADKIQPLYGYSTDDYVSMTQYVFYLYEGSINDRVYTINIDGTEIYVRDNGNKAFAKLADDKYIEGYLSENEYESKYTANIEGRYYSFYPEDYWFENISSESLMQYPEMQSIITVKNGGAVLVISRDILDFFGGDDFDLLVRTENSYSSWFSRDDLLAVFDQHENPKK